MSLLLELEITFFQSGFDNRLSGRTVLLLQDVSVMDL